MTHLYSKKLRNNLIERSKYEIFLFVSNGVSKDQNQNENVKAEGR